MLFPVGFNSLVSNNHIDLARPTVIFFMELSALRCTLSWIILVVSLCVLEC